MTARRAALAGATLSLLVGGCGGGANRMATMPPPPPPEASAASAWRQVATAADRLRLRGWRDTWLTALARARAAAPAEVVAAGAVLQPDVALDRPVPPPGRYRCRVFKLGAKSAGMPDYLAYPWFDCRIGASAEGEAQLVKLTGSQRHVGVFYRDDLRRAVFLGTLMLADETRAIPYGRDADRDLAGWTTRTGPAQWRIAMPQPAFESLLTIIELVPAG
ncbi:DUF4893 domain-containing protein [Sphingomonas adhaesiva]|uniref:DUF4893 domain-containing protein n=1 Tax=Sphingomonas adhaesiva TaxID=28212 RepID=UPI002FFCB266